MRRTPETEQTANNNVGDDDAVDDTALHCSAEKDQAKAKEKVK